MTNAALNWMTPLDRIVFQNAIKAKRNSVVLDHHIFELVYLEDNKVVRFFPHRAIGRSEFVPRGTLEIRSVLSDDFLEA